MNSIDLTGRMAIITGGSSGIGLATTERFLKSGATVQIWGRDTGRLDRAIATLRPHGSIDAQAVDVTDVAAVERATAAFLDRHGRIDVLFNNAGLSLAAGPLTSISVEEWHHTLDANLSSVFYCSRAVVPSMRAAGYGRIINNASMAGKDGNAFQGAYSAAKAGVIGLTKSLAKELATSGVLVNCIAPTLFETPLMELVTAAGPDVFDAIREKIPMRRPGLAEEAASMVAWIASADCSFTTGFTFDLSGGRATY